MSENEIIELLKGIKTELLDLKLRVREIDAHLKRQDGEIAEVVQAFRQLSFRVDEFDDQLGPDGLDLDDFLDGALDGTKPRQN